MEKIYFESLGCSKNQVDLEKMLFLLKQNGYKITNDPEQAEYIIINTCCFIRLAKEESIDTILELSKFRKNGICKKLIVAGCFAQYYSQALKKEIPEIDVIFGVGDISLIVDAINKKDDVIIPEYTNNTLIERNFISYPGSAYLKISEGCSNYCTYCLIPLIRGKARSREIYNILEEVDFLKNKQIKEISIIAQDTTSYGIDIYNKKMLAELIRQIDDTLDNSSWIRVLYMHPDHIDMELLLKLKQSKHLIPYFDIPFQSGSKKILNLMNRNGTPDSYLELIRNIRSIFDDVMVRSTFIAGFPDETEKDFEETLEFINNAQLDWVGGFTYSKEQNTIAGKMKDQIKESVKKKRLSQILDLSEEIMTNRLARFVNTKQKIFIEERVAHENLYMGRFWAQAPEVDSVTVVATLDAKIGDFMEAKIIELNDKDFYAIG